MTICQFLFQDIVIGYFLWLVAVAPAAAFSSPSILLHHLCLFLLFLQFIENANANNDNIETEETRPQTEYDHWGGSLTILVIEVGEPVSSGASEVGDTAQMEPVWEPLRRCIAEHASACQALLQDTWDMPVGKVNKDPCPVRSHCSGERETMKNIASMQEGDKC